MRTSPELELAWETPAPWAERVLEEPLALLDDHAHCELGAAAAAQSLLTRSRGNSALVERLSALALEELRHFKSVHRLLVARGGALQPPRTNPYAEALVRAAGRGARSLLDRLLAGALIERRSLERFELLHAAARGRDPGLAELYAELAPSEAGHGTLLVGLARELFPEEDVDGRLCEWIAREGELIRSLPFAARIHSGPPLPEDGMESAAGTADTNLS